MNIMFWVILSCMLFVAIAILVYPLLKVSTKRSLAYKESNLKINDEKIKELDLDLKEGRIDQGFYKAAREELDKELLIDIPAESQQTAALHYSKAATRHPTLALVVSIFIPMVALLLYLDLGMHTASDETFVANQAAPVEEQLSVEEMAVKLEAHIEENGGSVQEWAMLGRAHKHLGKYTLAAKAFSVALEQDPANAQLMLESAEVMALANDRIFTPEAIQRVEKAYQLEPDNANVLWFAGVSAYQAERYETAIDRLLQLLPIANGEEEVMQSIISIVAKSREKLVAAGKEMPELEAMLGVEAIATETETAATEDMRAGSAVTGTSLTISVDVSDDVRSKFSGSDTIFVYAKAKQGPKAPLAVKRLTLAALPATVVLDDSMAMMEGMNLSAFDNLEVSARVTKSGSAISQSGDFIGRTDVADKKSKTGLNVVIDTLVP